MYDHSKHSNKRICIWRGSSKLKVGRLPYLAILGASPLTPSSCRSLDHRSARDDVERAERVPSVNRSTWKDKRGRRAWQQKPGHTGFRVIDQYGRKHNQQRFLVSTPLLSFVNDWLGRPRQYQEKAGLACVGCGEYDQWRRQVLDVRYLFISKQYMYRKN
jgi:hypothetical protein